MALVNSRNLEQGIRKSLKTSFTFCQWYVVCDFKRQLFEVTNLLGGYSSNYSLSLWFELCIFIYLHLSQSTWGVRAYKLPGICLICLLDLTSIPEMIEVFEFVSCFFIGTSPTSSWNVKPCLLVGFITSNMVSILNEREGEGKDHGLFRHISSYLY